MTDTPITNLLTPPHTRRRSFSGSEATLCPPPLTSETSSPEIARFIPGDITHDRKTSFLEGPTVVLGDKTPRLKRLSVSTDNIFTKLGDGLEMEAGESDGLPAHTADSMGTADNEANNEEIPTAVYSEGMYGEVLKAASERAAKLQENEQPEQPQVPVVVASSTAPSWNTLFQNALDSLCEIRDSDVKYFTPHHHKCLVSAWTAVRDVAADFVYAAQSYGKIIIGEKYLPEEAKTIKSARVGGIAGGTKYIVNGILFKFATDDKGLFGGDDYLAAKTAGHELKSCVRLFNVAGSIIRVPLMATVDFLGYRLTAMSLLPITAKSILYGSSNAGRIVHADDPVVVRNMEHICTKLNLKGHTCGTGLEHKTLWGPTDIEVHRGSDGRFYIIDLSRLFPPERPVKGVPGCSLHRLLRPELVYQYKTPLSSDAYTNFGHADENELASTAEVAAATEYLHNSVIPAFAESLSHSFKSVMPQSPESLALISKMHTAGINLRHLGQVWSHTTTPSVRNIITHEIAARIIKKLLNNKLRELMTVEKKLTQSPFRRLIVDYLNVVLNRCAFDRKADPRKAAIQREQATLNEWQTVIHPMMVSSYEGYTNDWAKSMDVDPMGIYLRLQDMIGLDISQEAINKFFKEQAKGYSLYERDLLSLPSKVTHMDFFSIAEAHLLNLTSQEENNEMASQFLQWSIDIFTHVISGNPTSYNDIYELGLSQYHLATRGTNTNSLFEACCTNVELARNLHGRDIPERKLKYSVTLKAVQRANNFCALAKCFSYNTGSTALCLQLCKQYVMVGRKDGFVEKVNLKKPKKKREAKEYHRGSVKAISVDDGLLTTMGFDNKLKLWNSKGGVLQEVPFSFEGRAFQMRNKVLVIAGGTRKSPAKIGVWLMGPDGKYYESDFTCPDYVECIFSLSVDDTKMVTGGADCARLWPFPPTTTKPPISLGDVSFGPAFCVLLIEETDLIAVGYEEGTIRLFTTLDGGASPPCCGILTGHNDAVTCMSTSGLVLASGSNDGTFRLWDLLTNMCIKVVEDGPVGAIHVGLACVCDSSPAAHLHIGQYLQLPHLNQQQLMTILIGGAVGSAVCGGPEMGDDRKPRSEKIERLVCRVITAVHNELRVYFTQTTPAQQHGLLLPTPIRL
ncbi:Histidine kinase A [Pelomyxa schiedti]|nr:Histidine kinase A [Pelomyxa schiedti]